MGVHVHNRIHLAVKNEIVTFSRKFMDLDIIILSKTCQTQTNISHVWSVDLNVCMCVFM